MNQSQNFSDDCNLLRQTSPVILNLTNYVAMTPSANALLAVGASPVMSLEPLEMAELTSISSAVVINIGCLEQRQIEAMETAASTAAAQGKPWVLDPAGAGASRLRSGTAGSLIEKYHPAIIRGNAAEILAVCGADIKSRGVDSAEDPQAALEAAEALAREIGSVIIISGPTDYITDGSRTVSITGGSQLMPKVTAMGCISSALCAAFAAVDADTFSAACNAMRLMSEAGEKAGAKSAGTGSFYVNFMDELNKTASWIEKL